jgi:hypothetical protein
MMRVPVDCVWIVTANNPQLSREMARRTIEIRMDAGVENPEYRTNFRHPDLKRWCLKNRPLLVWAALTLVQSWLSAGSPMANRPLGMFQGFADVLGGILEHAGIQGFLEGVAAASKDIDTVLFSAFLRRSFELFSTEPCTAAQLLPNADELDLGQGDEKARARKLGLLLHERQGQWRSGLSIKALGTRSGSRLWQLETLKASEDRKA